MKLFQQKKKRVKIPTTSASGKTSRSALTVRSPVNCSAIGISGTRCGLGRAFWHSLFLCRGRGSHVPQQAVFDRRVDRFYHHWIPSRLFPCLGTTDALSALSLLRGRRDLHAPLLCKRGSPISHGFLSFSRNSVGANPIRNRTGFIYCDSCMYASLGRTNHHRDHNVLGGLGLAPHSPVQDLSRLPELLVSLQSSSKGGTGRILAEKSRDTRGLGSRWV